MRLPPHVPVLARPGPHGGIDVQVGLSTPVILAGLAFDEREFLATLEGGTLVIPGHARRFGRVISRLTAAGAWEAPAPPSPTVTVAVYGAGAVGMATATLAHAMGMAVSLCDDAPPRVEAPGTYGGTVAATCAAAAARVLAARGVTARIGGGGADLAVIVCTAAPDPVVTSRMMQDDVPHLLVACDGVGVWLSHMIVPGVTACGRCRDMELTRSDPAWPRLALQLGGSTAPSRRPTATPLARAAAVARIGARLADWMRRDAPGTAEVISPDGALCPAPLAPDPGCGCGAAGPVGDEVAARRARWRHD